MLNTNTFQEKFPFISCVKSNEKEYVGIIINFDNVIASIYDISMMLDEQEKIAFLNLGEIWWWESNRRIPINIFLKTDWIPFRPYRRTFINKDLEILCGPICSLGDICRRKSKRRSITLVRRTD